MREKKKILQHLAKYREKIFVYLFAESEDRDSETPVIFLLSK